MKKFALAWLGLFLLVAPAACANGQFKAVMAAAGTTVSSAQQKVQTAIELYGIAKGIAQVAAADPQVAAVVTPAIAVLDPLVAKAQTALNDATTDANALTALAAQIQAQATALTLVSAPAIKAVPSSPAVGTAQPAAVVK